MNNNSENVRSIWSGNYHSSINPPNNADVVIIGGGIIGVSTAYFLAKEGVNVCLCEKGFISGEQSGRNWGYVRVQGRDEREIPMMLESLKIWRNFNSELNGETGFEQGGCIYTAYNERELQEYRSWIDLAEKYAIKTEMIDKKDLSEKVGLGANNWIGGIITRTDGRAEPQKATLAISQAAEKLGATIITGCSVRGLETSAGKVSKVITEKGAINTSAVLCAAGAWSSFFCRSLDIKVPQLKVKGTVARTNSIETKINGNIFDKKVSIRKRLDGGYTIAHGAILDHPITPSTLYFAPKYIQALVKEFNVLKISIGKEFIEELTAPKTWDLDKVSPFERNRVLNPKPNKNIISKITNQVGEVYPELKGAKIIESWAGMVETTPDVVPVIAPLQEIPGLFLATGFSGHGFGIGPGAGKVISKMIQNKPTIDLHPFRLERFFDGSPIKVDSTI